MTSNVKIPKIIMQTWKGPESTLPKEWKESPISIRTMMPDWEYVLMTDEDNLKFIEEHFPEHLQTFKGFEYGIQRADFIRYAWLYVNGGLYLDCDYKIDKPLDELFEVDRDIYVCPSGNFGDYYTNAIIASKPKQSVWLECMKLASEEYSWWAAGKHLKVMSSTGPLMFTKAVGNQNPNSMHVLNSKLLTPCSVCDKKPCSREGGYITTLEGSSWCGWDTSIFTYCKCKWRSISVLIIILIVVIWIIFLMHAYRDPRSIRKPKRK